MPPWVDLVAATLAAGHQALDLVAAPEVAESWDAPSTLPEMTVGALAAHLAQMIKGGDGWLTAPAPTEGRLATLVEVFGRVRVDDDQGIDAEIPTMVRGWAADGAAPGPEAVADAARADLERLAELLAEADPDRFIPSVSVPGIGMCLHDYLRTRCVEFVVHTDDLAVSVGLPSPAPDPAAAGIATGVLIEMARARVGDLDVVRALARTDRVPPDTLRSV